MTSVPTQTAADGPVRRAADVTADERGLRALVRSSPGMTVLTGGQTGVDTLAAQAALRAGLPVHLIFPKGYRQEDGGLTTARRRALGSAMLHQLGSASFRYRTWTLVYLADAVLLFDPAGGAGCAETAAAARRLGRPLLQPMQLQLGAADVGRWLDQADSRVVAVAGCRASRIASQHAGRGLRAELAAAIDAISARHTRLLESDLRVR